MSKSASAELINNNTEIFRIYSRRLSNPADADIFITSARKLTSFLSNLRAYYAEAQQPIVDILEVTCNSLKSIAPDVFSTAGFMDRSAIPEDKAPLFEAFVQLIDTVTPYVPHFTDKYQNNFVCFCPHSASCYHREPLAGLLLTRHLPPRQLGFRLISPRPKRYHRIPPVVTSLILGRHLHHQYLLRQQT
ncbi:hypothetical protein BGW80DRAFT_398944 [Lactifluus volemus]|nr:hypothetical protein BGW80DRAFT_398944 [Lactifluus volemus]